MLNNEKSAISQLRLAQINDNHLELQTLFKQSYPSA